MRSQPFIRRLCGVVAVLAVALAAPAAAQADLTTEDLSGPLTPTDLANQLAGAGVSVSNVTFTGVDRAGGRFSGGTGIIGFESGVILSSGDIANVIGPNVQDNITAQNGQPGDADLNALGAASSQDAAVLEFDFRPNTGQVVFQYVFASDEYNEFANSNFDDVFGFFVNGTNCALVPGTNQRVSINTINGGNPFGTNAQNPQFYRNNDLQDGGGTINTEMDGLTVVLTCTADVNAGQTNHMKLAIADKGDQSFDSNVFLQAGSLVSTQCSDGIDNDGDNKVDHPADPGCSSPGDNDETDTPTGGLPGKMNGKGSLTGTGGTLSAYAFVLNCTAASNNPPAFTGKKDALTLKVTTVTTNTCSDDPAKTPEFPSAGFDTMIGTGNGTLNSTNVKVEWKFVDGGVEGSGDSAEIVIRRASDNVVLFSGSGSPPGKFPGSRQATGFNTALPPASP